MEGWEIAIIVKPLALLLFFAPGAILVWWLKKKMPDCALKRFLLISWKV